MKEREFSQKSKRKRERAEGVCEREKLGGEEVRVVAAMEGGGCKG